MLGITHLVGFGGGADYRAEAVSFDGTNDHLSRGADLSGTSDGKAGCISCWVRLGATASQVLLSGTAGFPEFRFDTSNQFVVDLYTSVPAGLLRMNTGALTNGVWAHVLASWDLAASASHLYLNDASSKTITVGPTNNTIDYTRPDHAVGVRVGPTLRLTADLADLYVNYATYIDFSVEANRRKFITAAGKPAYLGADGSLPTGSAPAIFLTGPVDAWHINKGAGGGFTETGALTGAGTSPSD